MDFSSIDGGVIMKDMTVKLIWADFAEDNQSVAVKMQFGDVYYIGDLVLAFSNLKDVDGIA